MNCEKYEQLISPYVDNELSDEEKEDLLLHLEQCQDCRGQLEAIGFMKNMAKMHDTPAPVSNTVKSKVYYKLYRDLLIIFTGLVIIISMVAVSGGLAQLLLFDKISNGMKILFFSGVVLLLIGLIVLMVDVFLDLFRILLKRK